MKTGSFYIGKVKVRLAKVGPHYVGLGFSYLNKGPMIIFHFWRYNLTFWYRG